RRCAGQLLLARNGCLFGVLDAEPPFSQPAPPVHGVAMFPPRLGHLLGFHSVSRACPGVCWLGLAKSAGTPCPASRTQSAAASHMGAGSSPHRLHHGGSLCHRSASVFRRHSVATREPAPRPAPRGGA